MTGIRKRVVTFSSGAGSWAAAQRVKDQHGTDDMWLLFADVKGDNDDEHTGEDADNYRFLRDAALDLFDHDLGLVNQRLVSVSDGRDIWQVFHDNRFLGNTRLANCSKLLKQAPSRRWVEANCEPERTVLYLGIDWSEQNRIPANAKGWAPYMVAYPMCQRPFMDKAAVLADLRRRGIEPPRLYDMGFAHANCGGFCVRSGQGQMAQLLKVMPERYAYHERKEQELRDYLGKDVSILRDRRGGTVTPLTLQAFRERHEAEPAQTDMFDIGGCGCFSEAGAA